MVQIQDLPSLSTKLNLGCRPSPTGHFQHVKIKCYLRSLYIIFRSLDISNIFSVGLNLIPFGDNTESKTLT